MAAAERTMRCIEINKEVILLRKPVRQARICVIHKLTREAKKLRDKRGDEKQLEKNKRKADKLGREVTALKSIKDDQISKFGIMNLEKLSDMIQDPTTTDANRIIAKVANYKSLITRIKEFREKFPDYAEHISSKKKKSKSKDKKADENNAQNKETSGKQVPGIKLDMDRDDDGDDNDDTDDDDGDDNDDTDHDGDDDDDGQIHNDSDSNHDDDDDDDDHNDASDNYDNDSQGVPSSSEADETADQINANVQKPQSKVPSSDSRKSKPNKRAQVGKKNLEKEVKIVAKNDSLKNKPPKPVKVISKEATVKRFTEILQEESTENVVTKSEVPQSQNENTEVEKEVDDFFMSADGNEGHTVTVPSRSMISTNTKWNNVPNDRHLSKNPHKKHIGRLFGNEKKHPSGPKRNAKWNKEDRFPQNKAQARTRRPDNREKGGEPEKKKPRRNNEVTAAPEAENLHPSWQARKKQQEIMKQGFQGKKIVFGDD